MNTSRRTQLKLASANAFDWLSPLGAATALAMGGLTPAKASAAGAGAGLLLPSCELTYDLTGMQKGLQYQATATLRWQRNDTAYQAELSARILVIFKRRQVSQGALVSQALRPSLFTDEGKRIKQATFKPKEQAIAYTESGPALWTPPTQDRLSIYFMLPQLMAQARLRHASSFSVPVSSANSLVSWDLTMGARDTINTPMGQWSAQTLTRVKQTTDDTSAQLWFGGANDLLPLRIRLEDNEGTWLEQSLRSQTRIADLA